MSKKITILGAGESGVGAAILAKKQGFQVLISDAGVIADNFRQDIEAYKIEFEEKGHTSAIFNADEIIKSPGITDDADIMKQIYQKEISVISEIEFASRFTDSKLILITGTNGKTTTTLLTHHLLKNGGLSVGLTGNVGLSLARAIAEDPKEYYVVEVSSFQLDQSFELKADVAILLNITPDHLDRYQNELKNYVRSKFRLVQNMKSSDPFIYNYDDDIIKSYIEKNQIIPELVRLSLKEEIEKGGFVKDNTITTRLAGQEYKFDLEGLPLRGYHNAVNMMASILCAMNYGLSHQNILEGLASFKNAPHRMEKVATIDGIDFVNDSKATNVDAAFYALNSYPAIIWIAGGKDKGNDYEAIKGVVKERVKALVCLGKDNSKLVSYFESVVPQITDIHSIREAVRKAYEYATEGDTVLLSPACASFDLFQNYQDRGDQFKNEVLELKNELESKVS